MDFGTRVPLPPTTDLIQASVAGETNRAFDEETVRVSVEPTLIGKLDGAFRTKQRGDTYMSQGDPTEPVVEQAPTEQAPAATEQAPVEQASEEQQQAPATEPEPVAASPVADTAAASDSPVTEAEPSVTSAPPQA